MLHNIKKVLIQRVPFLSSLIVINTLLISNRSYLKSTGYMESFKRGYPCDKEGEALPLMNYAVIAFLKERLNKEISIFEYGSGFSTTFYANYVDSITSLEYDLFWFNKVKKSASKNVTMLFEKKDENGKYCRVIGKTDTKYNIVVIDGRDRVNCAYQCLNSLSSDGVIIFDDSQRDRYFVGLDFLESKGFKRIHFEGLKPRGKSMDRTTIFYKDNNCLGI